MAKKGFNLDGIDLGIGLSHQIPISVLLSSTILNETPPRQQIGFVQQEPILFNRTIAENITYGTGKFFFGQGQKFARPHNGTTVFCPLRKNCFYF